MYTRELDVVRALLYILIQWVR